MVYDGIKMVVDIHNCRCLFSVVLIDYKNKSELVPC